MDYFFFIDLHFCKYSSKLAGELTKAISIQYFNAAEIGEVHALLDSRWENCPNLPGIKGCHSVTPVCVHVVEVDKYSTTDSDQNGSDGRFTFDFRSGHSQPIVPYQSSNSSEEVQAEQDPLLSLKKIEWL